jgi:hypothetical protein
LVGGARVPRWRHECAGSKVKLPFLLSASPLRGAAPLLLAPAGHTGSEEGEAPAAQAAVALTAALRSIGPKPPVICGVGSRGAVGREFERDPPSIAGTTHGFRRAAAAAAAASSWVSCIVVRSGEPIEVQPAKSQQRPPQPQIIHSAGQSLGVSPPICGGGTYAAVRAAEEKGSSSKKGWVFALSLSRAARRRKLASVGRLLLCVCVEKEARGVELWMWTRNPGAGPPNRPLYKQASRNPFPFWGDKQPSSGWGGQGLWWRVAGGGGREKKEKDIAPPPRVAFVIRPAGLLLLRR